MKKKILIIGAIIACIILIQYFDIYTRALKIYYPDDYAEYVDHYAKEYEIDRNWIFALIKTESDFRENSVSTSGAIGLMQLMEKTADEMAEEIRNRGDRPEKSRNKYTNRNEIFCKTC